MKIFKRLVTAVMTVLGIAVLSAGCHSGSPAESPKGAQPEASVLRGTLLIDPDFSGIERKAIEDGLAMWISALNGALDVDIADEPLPALREALFEMRLASEKREEAGLEPDEDAMSKQDFWSREAGCVPKLVIIRTTSMSRDVRMIEAGSKGKLLGLTNPNCVRKSILIVADRMESPEMMSRVVVHELGHAWGLMHNFKHNASIMFPREGAWTAPCITRADTTDFCGRWHCDARRMTPQTCEKK